MQVSAGLAQQFSRARGEFFAGLRHHTGLVGISEIVFIGQIAHDHAGFESACTAVEFHFAGA